MRVTGLVEAFALVVSVAALAACLGRLGWPFELASHFRLQYFLLCAPLFAWLAWRRRPLALAPLMGALASLGPLAPLYLASPPPAALGSEPLVVLQLNVNAQNRAFDEVLAAIESSGADVVFVIEASAPWIAALEPAPAGYRMLAADPAVGNFGMAALARVPARARVLDLSEQGHPSIEVTVEGDRRWTLLGTHPPPPLLGEMSEQRNRQLARLAAWARAQTGPHAVIGDLNTTPFSFVFDDLLEASGLHDSSRGFGYQPTWPFGLALLAPLRVPIDHVLVSDELTVRARAVGPAIGSDHRPLQVALEPRARGE